MAIRELIATGLHRLVPPLVVMACISGCAARPSMDELKDEAAKTGDWSEVEKRERMDRRMGLYDPDTECPNGQIYLCDKKGEHEQCECVASHTLQR